MSMYESPETKQPWFKIGHDVTAHTHTERWLVMFGRYSIQIIKRRKGWNK